MIAAGNLDARYVKAIVQHSVTILQPLADGTHKPVCGRILGEMHSRGVLHHYRVSIGHGTVLLVPPEWLHPESRLAVKRAGLTILDHPAEGTPDSRLGPSNPKRSETQQAFSTDTRLARES